MKNFILLLVCAITVTAHHANAQWVPPFFGSPNIINTNPGNVQIRQDLELIANNNGTPTFGAIRFGIGSGETIASKRTAGGNQFGLDFYTAFQRRMSITQGGDLELLGNNNGASTLGALRFGVGSGEAIASKRTAGGNQFGLDFYTAFQRRMSITQGGDLELLGNNNGASTLGALRFGVGSGEAIASKRTAGGNQFGLDFYTAFQRRMSIAQNGNVGIGTIAPVRKLQIQDGDVRIHSTVTNSSKYLEFLNTGVAGNIDWRIGHVGNFFDIYSSENDFATNTLRAYFESAPANGFVFHVLGQSTGSAWVTSDARLKKDVNTLDNAMDLIRELQPRTYNFKTKEYAGLGLSEKKQYGFIAQEMEEVLPELVATTEITVSVDKNGERKKEKVKVINYTEVIPLLVKALQEQESLYKKQEQEIAELKQVVATLSKGQSGQSSSINTDDASSKINVIATDAILEQNAPNPSIDGTDIRYYIPSGTKNAQLIITDILGRTVKQVPLSSGKGVINIDVSILSSGVYNYSLLIDGKLMRSKKMVIKHK